ncbi:serpin 28Dc [Musca autumnalis]|uniref:serpin 28Dc n=1 Tax=Musca autumnalis TaxID=221902 RepID=UPI003CFA3447
MRFLINWQLGATPTLSSLVLVLAIANLAAGDGLISQTNTNPLNMGQGQLMNSPPPPSQHTESNPSFTFTSTSSLPPSISSSQSSVDATDIIAENVLQFGLNMAQQLNFMDPSASRSEIFSPLSLMSALSLLMLGAKGKTYHELKTVLGLDNVPEFTTNPGKFHQIFSSMLDDMQHFDVNTAGAAGVTNMRKHPNWFYTTIKKLIGGSASTRKSEEIIHTINIANGLFVQDGYSLNPDYRQIVGSIYASHLAQLDYKTKLQEAIRYINQWSNDNTNGKIPELISGDISSTTNIILASTLYFRGFWETPFFQRSTREENFYQDGPNARPIRIKLMATGGIFPFYDAKEYDCRIIGLPYKGNETTMYIIQPNDSTRLKLRGLMSVLDARKINQMIDNMAMKTTVMVFPKMHFTRTMTLNDILPAMGVHDVFHPGLSDLSLIGGRNSAAAATPLPVVVNNARRPLFSSVATPVVQPQTTRKGLSALKPAFFDRYNESPLIFSSRFGEIEETESTTTTTEKPDMENNEETTTEANARDKRQVSNLPQDLNLQALSNLESARFYNNGYQSDLFVNEIIHKVDFAVDEQGTEAAAATVAYLYRSGTDVVFRGDTPFLILIRNDHTKLPLFFGVINKPEL